MNTSARLAQLPRQLLKRIGVAALIGGLAVSAGVGVAVAHNAAAADADPLAITIGGDSADMAAHVDKLLQHVYVEIDATDAQKTQLDPLVRQAITDLMPLHAQFHDGHAQMLALLTQDKIDRAALETFRADHVRAMDQASQRITRLIADVAEVLTPAQRRTFIARMSEHHAGWHHG